MKRRSQGTAPRRPPWFAAGVTTGALLLAGPAGTANAKAAAGPALSADDTDPSMIQGISGPTTVAYRRAFTVTGVLRDARNGRALPGRPVTLQYLPAGTTQWADGATVQSDYAGALIAYSVLLPWTSEVRWSFAGEGRTAPATSAAITVRVRPYVNLCCGGTVKLGKSHAMTGFLGDEDAGRKVTLQRYSGGVWSTAGSCTTNAESICTLTVKPSATGTYRYRTFRTADARFREGASSPETVKVVR